jgi:monovalent cation:proton antiporter-2 (CPA2) family protein
MTDGLLAQAFVYLAAAVLGVPLAKRLGLGSVLGYLLAGVVIGPFVLGLVGGEGHDVMHFAEFGVVMMLFLVGLELRPATLWQLRRPILGLGGLQVSVTAALVTAAAIAGGIAWKPALAVGLILAMSSTAIVLQSLAEKGQLRTPGGQSAFSILLFQDIAVIPILAIFPLLAEGSGATGAVAGGRPGWQQALLVLGAVVGLIGAGRYVVRPAFRLLAETRLREIFTAATLLLVVGIAWLMQSVGLSPALGTFLAGVVLAESEYRHELESDLEPFKGLLLGLFFLSVGAQIDFAVIAERPLLIAGLVIAVVLGKLLVLYALARLFGLDRPARWLLAFSLSQVGEFAFVLLTFGVSNQVFGKELTGPLVAVVALSMVTTPLLLIALERLVLPRLVRDGSPERPADPIVSQDSPVIIAGFGRFGQVVGRMLRANRIPCTVLDLDPNMVEVLGRIGFKVHYGDASRPELLHAAGCDRARLFVLAVDDMETSTKIAEHLQHTYPDLPVLARARNRQHYYELSRLGVATIYRETFGSAVELATETLRRLGVRAYTAQRIAAAWRQHDERALQQLSTLWGGDESLYFAQAKRSMAEAERLLSTESPTVFAEVEAEWDNDSLRDEVLEAVRAAGEHAPAPHEPGIGTRTDEPASSEPGGRE